MKTLFLDEIRRAIGGKIIAPISMTGATGVSTDSRSMRTGDLFFALKGPNFDGHDYIGKALADGAAGVVVEKTATLPADIEKAKVLIVDDCVAALGKLASHYRNDLTCTVIAVTGSNGKTTTKEMISHVLSKRLRGRGSSKSFNNHIGVPLTLLSAEAHDDFLVVEVGTNHPGEIDYLGSIVRPNIAAIINVGQSHLEGFGSVERVAAEKASLAKYVRPGGAVAVNGDNDLLLKLIGTPEAMMIRFGAAEENDMRISEISQDGTGIRFKVNDRFEFALPVLGRHNALNGLAAIVVARRLGYEMSEIAEGLRDFQLPAMRLEVMSLGKFTVLNDAYNANPNSMASALEVLGSYETKGRRIFCCGQMMELGSESERLHCQLARQIGSNGVDGLVAVGQYAGEMIREATSAGIRSDRVWAFESSVEAGEALKNIVEAGDLILVKGSRSMKMEHLIDRIKALSAIRSGGRLKAPGPGE